MNDIIAIIFVLALIFISTAGREFEAGRDTTISIECIDWEEIAKSATEGMNFKEGMEVVDSLWDVIQAIEFLEDNYFILDKRYYEKRTIEMLEYGEEGYFKK